MKAEVSTLHTVPFQHSSRGRSNEELLSDWTRVRQLNTESNDRRGVDFFEDSARNVLLVNGSADDSFSFSFYPEDGLEVGDYEILRLSSNGDVLNNVTDIELMTTALPGSAVNMSTTLDFHSFPGKTNLTIEFRRPNGTLFDSIEVDYLAAGLGIYRKDPSVGRVLVSGTDRSFVVPDYKENLSGNNHHELGAFVQFLNGSTSDSPLSDSSNADPASLFRLDTIDAVIMQSRGQVDWDPAVCKLTAATWDGDDLLIPDGCGMGLAQGAGNETNSGGLYFGYDFEEYRAGNFDVLFEWDRFTEGSEFEDQEYTNYIKAFIGGDPPGIVRLVTPATEFSVDGGQDIYVEMINADNANVSSFSVAGAESPFPLRNGSYQQFSGAAGHYQSAVFVTTPGIGKRLPWEIEASRQNVTEVESIPEPMTFIDQSGFVFSYDSAELVVTSVAPTFVSEIGGQNVVVTGSFDDFNISNPEHNILFSNAAIDRSLLRSANETTVSFTAPSRSEVGSSWSYDVASTVGSVVSNSMTINYYADTIAVKTTIFGGSQMPGLDVFEFGRCSNVTILADESGSNMDNIGYSWTVVDPEGLNILSRANASDIVTTNRQLTFPVDVLPLMGTDYTATVRAENNITSGVSSSKIRRTSDYKIGVTLVDPVPRTVALPLTNLRIVAKIELPSCLSNSTSSLVYEWGWEEEGQTTTDLESNKSATYSKYQLKASDDNSTSGGETGIIRLGREFIVPRETLTVGFHRIYLWVFVPAEKQSANDLYVPFRNEADLNSTIQGSRRTTAHVMESALDAIIGDGELTVTSDGESDLEMSASRSFDPDAAEGESSLGLSYFWNCSRSWNEDLSDASPCVEELMPPTALRAISFTAESLGFLAEIAKSPNGQDSIMYLQYSLNVTKGNRISTSQQTVEITKRSELALNQLAAAAVRSSSNKEKLPLSVRQAAAGSGTLHESIELTNAAGTLIDPKKHKFWEELIVTPVIKSDFKSGTTWRFSMMQPAQERNIFFVSNRLLTEPGYYSQSGFTGDFQALPLGIKAGMLLPNQEYVFKVVMWYQESGVQKEGAATFCIKTMEAPRLIFPPLSISEGTVDTVFRTSARTNTDNDSAFLFQFYLTSTDDSTVDEYCIDGCTGAPLALFKTYQAGNYKLQARLLACNGKTVLDVADNPDTITAFPRNSTVTTEEYKNEMTRDFEIGDDGSVNQRGFFVSNAMRSDAAPATRSGVISMSSDDEEEQDACGKTIPAFIAASLDIAAKEQPTTANVRNYILLAANYARLNCIEDEDTLYNLLQIVDKSLERTPPGNTLQISFVSAVQSRDDGVSIPDMDIVQEAQRFFNFTMTRAISGQVARGTSRTRLAPRDGAVSNLILDLYEKWREHMTTVTTSDQVCGFERQISTEVRDGIIDEALASRISDARSSPFGGNNLKVSVRCNSDQGMTIEGAFSKFEWCPGVYAATGSSRKLISLAEMYDYVYLSGIQGANMTDSTRLIAVNITQLAEKNQLVSAMSTSSDVLAQQEGTDTGGADAVPISCYSIGMQIHEAAVRELEDEKHVLQQLMSRTEGSDAQASTTARQGLAGDNDSCRFNVFTLWPTKKYGANYTAPFQSNAYLRRSDGMTEDESRTNSSYVTINTGHLGLYGAVRLRCANSLQSSFDLSGTLASVVGMAMGILLMVVVVTGLTYVLATTLFVGEAGRPEDEINADAYVERDYFGRGVMQINSVQQSMTEAGTETTDEYGDSDMDLGAIEGVAFDDEEPESPPLNLSNMRLPSSSPPQ